MDNKTEHRLKLERHLLSNYSQRILNMSNKVFKNVPESEVTHKSNGYYTLIKFGLTVIYLSETMDIEQYSRMKSRAPDISPGEFLSKVKKNIWGSPDNPANWADVNQKIRDYSETGRI